MDRRLCYQTGHLLFYFASRDGKDVGIVDELSDLASKLLFESKIL